MTNDNQDALRCADEMNLFGATWTQRRADAAAHLRRLVAENEKLREWKEDAARLALDNLQLITQNEALEADNASLRRINEAQDAKLAEQDKLLRYAVNVISNTLIQSDRLHSMTLEQLEQCRYEIRQHLEDRV